MIAFYAQIKAVHIAAVLISGVLFLARGLMVQSGHKALAMTAWFRYASYSVDTVLLTAALMLATILPAALFANHWLALKRAQSARARLAAFVAALCVYVTIIGIARAHHPMGWVAFVQG